MELMAEWYILIIMMFGAVLLLVFTGLPIAVVLISVALLFLAIAEGVSQASLMIGQRLFDYWRSWAMLPIPLFILMGEFLFRGGSATDIYEMASKWLGHLRGGLALVTVAACAIFASMCGSTAGATATMAVVAAPEMRKRGYSDQLSCGCISAAGCLAHLIPPSLLMVVYASVAEVSPGRALIAGFIPGFILAAFYVATVIIWVTRSPGSAAKNPRASRREMIGSIKTVWQPLLIIFAVIGTIYMGIATVTEAAAVGALCAFGIAVSKRRRVLGELPDILLEATVLSCFIMFISAGGQALSLAMNYFLLPMRLMEFVLGMNLPPWGFILMVMALYMIMGCFMDPIGMMVITLPIIVPLLESMGYDLYWFGVMLMVNFEMALITPPFGTQLYILKGARPEVPLNKILFGSLAFFPAMILMLVILLLAPWVATFLPRLMMG
jgi:tripartite ATP-independent transporter DctM subunit